MLWESEKSRNAAIRTMLSSTPAVAQLWTESGPDSRAVDLLEAGGGYLSSGERVMLKAAFDLWNGRGGCTIGELLSTLDETRLAAVAHAVLARDRAEPR